jgi:hypothetical protein
MEVRLDQHVYHYTVVLVSMHYNKYSIKLVGLVQAAYNHLPHRNLTSCRRDITE